MTERPSGSPPRNPANLLVELILAEVQANATREEERAFFHSIGIHFAEQFPLEDPADLPAVEAGLNGVFRNNGLGTTRLSLADDAIFIRHRLTPIDGMRDDDAWRMVLPFILEGAYDTWLRTLGSGPKLRTSVVSSDGFTFELRHGL